MVIEERDSGLFMYIDNQFEFVGDEVFIQGILTGIRYCGFDIQIERK